MSVQNRGKETRTRILETAAERFAQNGYDGTPVAEICRSAGVTKGAFYHHFPSKQTVFLELLEQWLESIDAQLETLRAQGGTVPEKLVTMAGLLRPVLQMADGKLPIFLEFWSKASHEEKIWQALISPYRRYRTYFAHMIEEGIAEGSIRDVEPKVAAEALVSLALGLLLQRLLDPQGLNTDQLTGDPINMFLEGLLNK